MLTVKTPDEGQRRHCVFIFNFEQISHIVLVFSLLVLNKQMPAKDEFACHQRRYWLWFCVPPKMINYKKNAKYIYIFSLIRANLKVAPRLEKTEVFKESWNFANRACFASCIMKKTLFFILEEKNSFWTLDVSRTASYEITLIHLSVSLSVHLSVCPSVTKFSQHWIIRFFLIFYMMIADHDI